MRYATITAFLALAFLSMPVCAGPREDTLAGISRCASLPDDRMFLDCIYGAVQPMRSRLGLQPALEAQQRLVPPLVPALAKTVPQKAAPTPSERIGLSGMASTGKLQMAAYSFDTRGLFTVTLSDGTVWRQDATDTTFAHFGGKPASYIVTITAGEFGRIRMEVRGEPGSYLVERIR